MAAAHIVGWRHQPPPKIPQAPHWVLELEYPRGFDRFETAQKALTRQSILVGTVCDGLRDINENKLSKFELALLITKICDVMLDDDIQ